MTVKIKIPPGVTSVCAICRPNEFPAKLAIADSRGKTIINHIVRTNDPIELPPDAFTITCDRAITFLPLYRPTGPTAA